MEKGELRLRSYRLMLTDIDYVMLLLAGCEYVVVHFVSLYVCMYQVKVFKSKGILQRLLDLYYVRSSTKTENEKKTNILQHTMLMLTYVDFALHCLTLLLYTFPGYFFDHIIC